MTLTPETRAHLAEELGKLAAAEKQVETEMAPLREQMKPFNERLEAIEATREELLAKHGTYVAGHCESCSKVVLVGDRGYRYDDGIIECAECSPTLADMQQRVEEEDSWEDQNARLRAKAAVEQLVAAGMAPDTRYTFEL